MGELITQNGKIGQWLDKIDATRNELITSAKSGNRVAAAFAMADARVELIESLKDELIRAKLLRMTDPEIAMVELANNPSQEDRIRVCAIAILSGFTPGDDQFAVFGGGKNPGKLYTKERGFRTLFSHLGIVPEVRTSHPEFMPLGTAGKKIWRVGGTASCSYQGKDYEVDFSGDEMLGVPGYDTDNVAGIAAKARRRLLQALWVKVSPILTQDQGDDDDQDTVPVSQQAKRIEVAPVTHPPQSVNAADAAATKPEPEIVTVSKDEMEATISQHKLAGIAVIESLADDTINSKAYGDLWDAVGTAKTATNLKAEGKAIKNAVDHFTDSQLEPLRQWYTFRMNQITGRIRVA